MIDNTAIPSATVPSATSNGVYRYIGDFLTPAEADHYFAVLRDELDWVRHEGVPRSEHYSNDDPTATYSYGVAEYARSYVPQPWHPAVLEIRARLEAEVEAVMDVCFTNWYNAPKDRLGFHADDSEELDDLRPIVSVSLGTPRIIRIKANEPESPIESILLGHGSVFIMEPGVQDTHKHEIPKSGFAKFERISLTFRGFVPPDAR